jgi:hypothetical protein
MISKENLLKFECKAFGSYRVRVMVGQLADGSIFIFTICRILFQKVNERVGN